MFGQGEQIKLLKELLEEVRFIRRHLFPSRLTIIFHHGECEQMNSVTLTLKPAQTTIATVDEIFHGVQVTPGPNDLVFSLQDPTIASFTKQADGSAVFSPLAVGTTQVGCVDTVTGQSGTGTLTVVLGPDGLVINFSTPA